MRTGRLRAVVLRFRSSGSPNDIFVQPAAKVTLMIAVLPKRIIGWEEAIAVPFAFLLYYVVFSLLGGFRAAACFPGRPRGLSLEVILIQINLIELVKITSFGYSRGIARELFS
jgi:hypothetical protein